MYVCRFISRNPYSLSSHEARPEAKLNKWVFSRLPNCLSVSVESRSGSGRLFQSLGALETKLRGTKQFWLPGLVSHHEQLNAGDDDWQWLRLARTSLEGTPEQSDASTCRWSCRACNRFSAALEASEATIALNNMSTKHAASKWFILPRCDHNCQWLADDTVTSDCCGFFTRWCLTGFTPFAAGFLYKVNLLFRRPLSPFGNTPLYLTHACWQYAIQASRETFETSTIYVY